MPVAQLQPKEYIRSVADAPVPSVRDSLGYTRWLATHHYENFHVVSALLPRALHQDFYNVYAFCRWADDLGDEMDSTAESLRLLAWWRGELREMYRGHASHPVFVALRGTVEKHAIPSEPFERLIAAFEQDQTVTRYSNWDEVFGYCTNSANPVGHLLLYLCGYRDGERQQLSDFTCTALQLANFWQDVAVDLEKDRIYLPVDLLRSHGVTEEQLFRGLANAQFKGVMREAVDVAAELFRRGLPLVGRVNRRLALDIELFSRGGMLVLEKIRAQDYDVLGKRPHVTKMERAGLFVRCLPRLLR